MKNKILIINTCLTIGGGEKYVYELCKFAKDIGLQPYVLIPLKYKKEYYDEFLEKENIKVIRVNIAGYKHLLTHMDLKGLYWNTLLRFFLEKKFRALHIVNFSLFDQYKAIFRHPKRYIWHITNKAQFKNEIFPFSTDLFDNPNDSIVYCNEYQSSELKEQYQIACKEATLKLFLHSR